jgi:uracil-DNA glycosylase
MQKVENNVSKLPILLSEIRQCRECEEHLPLGPRPIVQADTSARILIIGQAPGRRVHKSGIPWDDASGERLRTWMEIERSQFYDPRLVALVPMGFCYPGTGDSGDLPPRKECAELWHEPLLGHLKNIQLTLLIGSYAQNHRLPDAKGVSLTATVQNWREYAPTIFPIPHPSPRNNRWLKKNPWFSKELLPALQRKTKSILDTA